MWAAVHCSTRVLAFVVLSMCRVRQSQALVRPGECIVNGDCQSDPERLHGVQDWEGYATHASGHSPSRYGRRRRAGAIRAYALCAARAMRPACAPRGVRALISGRSGIDATRGPPIFTGPAVTTRVSAARSANAALAVRLFTRVRGPSHRCTLRLANHSFRMLTQDACRCAGLCNMEPVFGVRQPCSGECTHLFQRPHARNKTAAARMLRVISTGWRFSASLDRELSRHEARHAGTMLGHVFLRPPYCRHSLHRALACPSIIVGSGGLICVGGMFLTHVRVYSTCSPLIVCAVLCTCVKENGAVCVHALAPACIFVVSLICAVYGLRR